MSNETIPIAVFDCMTFLQAVARSEGAASAWFQMVEAGRVKLVVSTAILAEVEDVLDRPKIRQKNPKLTDETVAAFLIRVRELAPPAIVVPAAFAYARDPDDEPYLNLAIVSTAGYIISRDNDLLDLMQEDNPDGQAFRALTPGIQILTPPEFLRVLRYQVANAS